MYKYFKRLADLVVAGIVLAAFSPIIILLTLLLGISNKGPVFFIQERPGKNNKVFRIVKFKTMNDKRDSFGKFLSDKDRITKVGKFIRSASLDEIPQFYNVLIGQMSIVGPRPLLTRYLPLYTSNQLRRHEVKPGITGWAQVNGRNAISWQKKFELDVWYVDNQSFFLDIRIIFLTIKKVFIRADINQDSNLTMEAFNGKN